MSSEVVGEVTEYRPRVAEIEELYGPVAAREFAGMYTTRVREVEHHILAMQAAAERGDAEEFINRAASHITASARMASYPYQGNFEDIHVLATIAFAIAERTAAAEGVYDGCQVHGWYARAFRKAYTEQGHGYYREVVCNCAEKLKVEDAS